ncbi:hypothetical protein SCUCBS95973_001910 [Sporothrix curviconia]|uniref:HTH CENPB-type domain-containing protein n=1 Tax=Sporothrix curviconia TaxID=1260050 RepID=A0ABP0B2J4_9PEZI
MASTGVDSEVQLAQDSAQYETNGWVNMNGYPQSTMAGFANSEFIYMPPIASLDLPQDGLHRMPPPMQPRQSPQMKHDQDLSQQTQQQKLQQQHPPLSMGQVSHHHQLPQLPMLTVPSNPTWPSMLTNPGAFAAPPPSIHVVPRNGPARPPPPPLKTKLNETGGRTGPRKMLTDDDRRRMCEYAEANPGVKQSEIGNIFGVERSTVSKVLRNKEKYLVKDKSPGAKKPKSKFPDLERALSNWVRNAQRTGVQVTDAEIREKFRFFAHSTGNPDTVLKAASNTWLEKFKQKNGLGTSSSRLVRRASETNIPDKRRGSQSAIMMGSPSLVPMEPTGLDSPVSPGTRHPSASPLSGNRSDEERNVDSAGPSGAGQFINFGTTQSDGAGGMGHGGSLGNNMTMGIGISGIASYNRGNNQSTTSLSSVFTETPVSSFSGSTMSPTVPFTFSPDSNVGSFLTSDPMAPPGSANFQRPRSQTLPALNLEHMHHPQDQQQSTHHGHNSSDTVASTPGGSMTPKFPHHQHLSSTAPSSAVDSPMTDISAPSYGIDSTVVSPQLRRSNSSNSLFQSGSRSAGGLGGSTILGSGGGINGSASTPNSPTQDDARRAADTLFNFIKHVPGVFDQTDFVAVSRLIEKLRLQATAKSHGGGGMGGLSRIPEGEGEMGSDAHTHQTKLESALAA